MSDMRKELIEMLAKPVWKETPMSSTSGVTELAKWLKEHDRQLIEEIVVIVDNEHSQCVCDPFYDRYPGRNDPGCNYHDNQDLIGYIRELKDK